MMPSKPYDITIYDATGAIVIEALRRNPGCQILSMFQAKESSDQVHVFGELMTARFVRSAAESEPIRKQLFLQSASRSAIRVSDLDGLSFAATALKLLSNGEIDELVIVSEVPIEGLLAMSSGEEMAVFDQALLEGRLKFMNKCSTNKYLEL